MWLWIIIFYLMKLISWNVNSVRARVENIVSYIKDTDPDIIFLQEIKTLDETFPKDVFKEHGMNHIEISPSKLKDSVQMDKKNKPDTYILDWWQPKTTLMSGITKVFEAMKNDWV